MPNTHFVDGALVQWGDRLFYPGNRIVRSPSVILGGGVLHDRARAIRQRLHATVVRGAPQVMVKITGGGRGMAAIATHLRYISKNGRLPIEDDRGVVRDGKDGVLALAEQWRHAGALIPEHSMRREAFNLTLSMPAGTPASALQSAARAFACAELSNHRYVMVLHTHQANPHVLLSVRAEGKAGQRLNPRKADLRRWRETFEFAKQLSDAGIELRAMSRILDRVMTLGQKADRMTRPGGCLLPALRPNCPLHQATRSDRGGSLSSLVQLRAAVRGLVAHGSLPFGRCAPHSLAAGRAGDARRRSVRRDQHSPAHSEMHEDAQRGWAPRFAAFLRYSGDGAARLDEHDTQSFSDITAACSAGSHRPSSRTR